ncbi:MAG: tetratricopeptide repeat protein [Nitrospira sp.]|nr:tetratricopeptide repeat protein [Nitrospira sp.]
MILHIVALGGAAESAYEIFLQGRVLEDKLQIFMARDVFQEAISKDPSNNGYREHFVWFLHFHGFQEEAVAIFEQLLEVRDEKSFLYRGIGYNLRVIGQLKQSLYNYEQIFAPDYPEHRIGTAFEDIRWFLHDENESRIEELVRQVEDYPEDNEARKRLFNLYMDQGEPEHAITLGRDYISRVPGDSFVRLQFARVHTWIRKYDAAEKEYRALIQDYPQSAFLYYELAKLLDSAGRPQEALVLIRKSLQMYPEALLTKRVYASLLAKTGEHVQAESVTLGMRQTIDSRLPGLLASGETAYLREDYEGASAAYKAVITDYQHNVEGLWGLILTSHERAADDDLRMAVKQWGNTVPDDRTRLRDMQYPYYLPDEVNFQFEFYDNSSEFERVNLGGNYNIFAGDDWRLEAGYTLTDFHQNGFDGIFRQSLHIEADKLINENLQLKGRLSGNFYDNNYENLNGKIFLTAKPHRQLTTVLKYSYFDTIDTQLPFENPIYNYVVTIGSPALNIRSHDSGAYVFFEPHPRLGIAGEIMYGDYSDHNRKISRLFEVSYKLDDVPYFKVAYDYFYLDFLNPSPVYREGINSEGAYIDPVNFESHTLRYEFAHDISEKWTYGNEGAVALIPKSDGITASLFFFAEYEYNQQNSFRLDLRGFFQNHGIDRIGITGHFWARNLTLTYRYWF